MLYYYYMSKSVCVTRPIPEAGLTLLREHGYDVDSNPSDALLSHEEVISLLQKKPYDGALTLLTDKIDAAVFDAAPSIKIYANYASGFDNIDLAEAHKRGITVTNAPAPLTSEAVAEHTIALTLALAARIVEADQFVRDGKYVGWSPMNFVGTDIVGKNFGLIGAGRIGERVAHYARGLGMSIFYTDVRRSDTLEKTCDATYCESIEKLLPQVDVVSLHVPLLPTTRHLINAERLRLMKPTAFLINTARGPVVEEAALEAALKQKTIAAAALDVFEFEPKVSPGLIALPNVILTPHIASASIATRDQMATIAAQNLIDFFEGRQPKYAVNK